MILDSDSLEFIEKSLTRTEAKKAHKELPEGGAWRTMNGHHIYIVNGKIVAGSVPGVTKAKKMTKATMAEHQAAIDAKGKKTSGSKTNAKKTSTKPAKPKASAKPGSDTGGKKTKATGAAKAIAKPRTKAPVKKSSEDSYEVFHGTALPKLENIMKDGFKPNGGHSDFGNAAYFKSPTFDHLDHKDHKDWVEGRQAKGQPVPERYLTEKGNDTDKIVKFFTDKKNPVVLKAFIPKEHVLDCSNGRPKELNNLIKEHYKLEGEGTKEAMMGFALKHILGMNTKGKSDDELRSLFQDNKEALGKAWGKDVLPFKISPYEVYAKKTGTKAIVDKLDAFKDEGWQIGVYDPSIIQIKDHGKGIQYNADKKTAELIKALLKSAKSVPYCLLHHTIDKDGLHLHVGVQGSLQKAFLYIDLAKGARR